MYVVVAEMHKYSLMTGWTHLKIIVPVEMLRNGGKIDRKDTINCHKIPISSADNIHLRYRDKR